MTRFRKLTHTLAVVLTAGLMIGAGALPARAAPFPPGAQATALVGGTPLVRVTCPAGSPGAVAAGYSTLGGVSVGRPAGARCTPLSASADGFYAIAGVTAPITSSTLRFSSQCQNSTGDTGNAVDVPAGTIVNGVPVQTTTTVTSLNTPVTFPGGQTAIVNEVIIEPFAVVRNAIRFTSGPNTGTIVGQVICGVRYPLVVDTPGAGTAGDLAAPAVPAGSDGGIAPWIVAAVGLLLIAQLALGGHVWRRRRSDPSA